MVIKRRIETERAEALRSKRQDFAAPGGNHDKLIGFLARALPMGVGVVAALMIIAPILTILCDTIGIVGGGLMGGTVIRM